MSGSNLIELMRKQARGQLQGGGIELATVIVPPPKLVIRIDNMDQNLQGDDLIVCEHLLEHTREYTTDAEISSSDMTLEGYILHIHDITAITAEQQPVTMHSRLEAGDRIAVQALPGGQQYLIIDKVVMMDG